MAGQDIVPELLEIIQKAFQEAYENSTRVKNIMKMMEAGTVSYAEAQRYAVEVGKLLGQVLQKEISEDILPYGTLYYNILQRILDPTLRKNYSLVTDAALAAQQACNDASGIGLKAVVPEVNADRLNGIADEALRHGEVSAVVDWLQGAIENFTLSAVDDTVKKNVEFQGKSGLSPRIVRRSSGRCCKWCSSMVGTYTYPDVPKDVYRRHQNCRCTVEYDPGNGKKQNVHTKQWKDAEEDDRIEVRKQTGTELKKFDNAQDLLYPVNPKTGERYSPHEIVIKKKQFGKKFGKHAGDFGLDEKDPESRVLFRNLINDIVNRANERRWGEWRGQNRPVLFHIRVNDVVVENDKGEFITILSGGVENERIKDARKQRI